MNRYGNVRGGSAFQRPENALKRAEELQRVGQKTAAVLALHDVLTSRRHRAWIKGLEDIVYRFIDLCVEERMGRYAKEALMQYRNTCQNVNINSLEEVIKYFLKKATERAEEAQAKADAVIQEIDDLDAEKSPEDLMLSYVSDKSNKDRADRELVAPWFKFLWETYRNILEILRNNVKFTQMYGMVTKQAFQFCLQYKRNTEFRRLCEILRNQLLTLRKNRDNRDNRDRPDLSNPETLNQCLETRFEQLNVACQLEMWQEAFRSIEDIHGLWAIYKKMPKPNLRAQYFSCLTQIFSKSGSHCYHAYSWYQLYSLSAKLSKSLAPADKSNMAAAVLLSTLAIDPYDRKGPESMGEHPRADRARRIIDILGFTPDPYRTPEEMLSRANLLTELHRHNILKEVPKDIAAIFKCLEQDRDPLHLCTTIAPYIAALEEQKEVPLTAGAPVPTIDFAQHVSQLRSVAVLKMMRQLSSVYSVMRIDKLGQLVPFMSFPEVEAVLADAIKFGYIQVQIDHRSGTLHFGGAHLRNDAMAAHLSTVAGRLAASMHLVKPAEITERQDARAAATAARARETGTELNKMMLARKVLIERRKEEHERAREEAEKEEEQKRRAEQQAREQEENTRREEEARKREADRLTREFAEQEAEEVQKMIREKGITVKEGEQLDKRALMQREYERKAREQNEFEAKMAKIARNMDYLERARREEEAPFIEASAQERVAELKQYYEAEQASLLVRHREKWEADIEAKKRSTHLHEDKEEFKKQVSERRAAEIARLREMQERKRRDEARRRQQERINLRKQKYIEQCRALIEAKHAELEVKAEEEAKEAAKREREQALEMARQRKEREAQEEEERQARAKARAEELAAQAKEDVTSAPSDDRGAAPALPTAGAGKYVPRSRTGPSAPAPAAASASREGAPAPYRPAARSGGAFGGDRQDRGGPRQGAPAAFGGGRRATGDGPPAFGGPRREESAAFGGGPRREESSAFGGPRRDEGRPSAFGSMRREDRPAPAQDAAPAPRPRESTGPKKAGGYVPPHLRGK